MHHIEFFLDASCYLAATVVRCKCVINKLLFLQLFFNLVIFCVVYFVNFCVVLLVKIVF